MKYQYHAQILGIVDKWFLFQESGREEQTSAVAQFTKKPASVASAMEPGVETVPEESTANLGNQAITVVKVPCVFVECGVPIECVIPSKTYHPTHCCIYQTGETCHTKHTCDQNIITDGNFICKNI